MFAESNASDLNCILMFLGGDDIYIYIYIYIYHMYENIYIYISSIQQIIGES